MWLIVVVDGYGIMCQFDARNPKGTMIHHVWTAHVYQVPRFVDFCPCFLMYHHVSTRKPSHIYLVK
jgi:hypothetical protein